MPFVTRGVCRGVIGSVSGATPLDVRLYSFPIISRTHVSRRLRRRVRGILRVIILNHSTHGNSDHGGHRPLGRVCIGLSNSLRRYCARVVGSRLGVGGISFASTISDFIACAFGPRLGAINPGFNGRLGSVHATLSRVSNGTTGGRLSRGNDVALGLTSNSIILRARSLLVSTTRGRNFCALDSHNVAITLGAILARRLVGRKCVHRLMDGVRAVHGRTGFGIASRVRVALANDRAIYGLTIGGSTSVINSALTSDLGCAAPSNFIGR